MDPCLSIPFDQYQRYKLVSNVIDKFRTEDKKFKILDVGAGFEENLKKFLPSDVIYCMDKGYPLEYSQKENFIVGDILKVELTEKYDFVVAIDVYEHIPQADRKKFVDTLIAASKIATVIAAPFDQENVKTCEFFANEIYKTSHGSDYIWLKEHIANGLPSLSLTIDLIKDHQLHPVIIPNGYLPRWFEMISAFLLTDGEAELSQMMTTLYELYNQNYYQYDNRDPAYRQIIIIPRYRSDDLDFSDLFSKKVDSEDLNDNNQLLESFIEKIKKSYQINEELKKVNKQLHEMTPHIQSLEQASAAKDEQLAELSHKYLDLTACLDDREKKLLSIEQSIIWQCTMKFHNKIIEKLLPQKTRRRGYYDLGLKGGKILINDGIDTFCWHYNERRRVKKIEHLIQKTMGTEKARNIGNNCSQSTIDQIKFPKPGEAAEVSIIIPVFNKYQYTLNCLKSISDNTIGSFEVVIVDDASTDETANQLKKIPNLTIIRNKENFGFVESCNTGAKVSKGKYLLFLNNDTVVTENWLPPLMELVKKENIGGVGAKLVYPDGTLQEAGGIIWKDGSGWNYGRGDNPEKSEYNYVRDVDYCSGAALLVRRDLFEKLEGFDRQFKPGYYEDTDLCFSIREQGYRVLYQPLSVVIHFEGISNGTDLSTGIKKYQEINRTKFFTKWEKILAEQHSAANSENVFNGRIRRSGKKILVIDHYVPTWDRDSGSYRMYNFLKLLVELNHKVTFIGDNLFKSEPYAKDLQQNGIEIMYYPTVQSIDEYLKDYGNFFDIVILSRSHIAIKHYGSVKKYCTRAKIIFDTVDLQYLRERRRAEIENDAKVLKEAENLKVTELFLVTHCDITFVVSSIEKELLLKETPQCRIEILSNIHEVTPCITPFCDRKDLMFVGGFNHQPNVDAMKWFTKEIFPQIIKSIPDIKLYIIGSDLTKEIEHLASPNIIVVGYVKELTPYFNNCRIFVSPLRYGAGVKGKINQSMSYGLPVVTTQIGAEGMYLLDRENALIADDENTFASKCIELYENVDLWNELSRNSLINVQRYFSYSHWKQKIESILKSITN